MPAEVVAHDVDPSPDSQGVQELDCVLGHGLFGESPWVASRIGLRLFSWGAIT